MGSQICNCFSSSTPIDGKTGKQSILNPKNQEMKRKLIEEKEQDIINATANGNGFQKKYEQEGKKVERLTQNDSTPKQDKTDAHEETESTPVKKQSVMIFGNHKKNLTIEDFAVEKQLGKGAFGKVLLVKKLDKKEKFYAMKVLRKADIVHNKLIENIVLERNILQKNKHPFVACLKYAFQTKSKVYLIMEYLSGGELFSLLRKSRRFPEEIARFYAAEVFLGLKYLHEELNVIYRDLKPENIMLANDGHIKITDFGLSKQTSEKTYTFAGTPEYLPPEIIQNKGHTKSVDWWSLGILIFEMLAGYPPFTNVERNFNKIEKQILENKPKFPTYFSTQAVDLIRCLLQTDPNNRLGHKDPMDIQNHPFFSQINFKDLMNLKSQPPNLGVLQAQEAKPNNKNLTIYKETMEEESMPYFQGITYEGEHTMNSQNSLIKKGFEFRKKSIK